MSYTTKASGSDESPRTLFADEVQPLVKGLRFAFVVKDLVQQVFNKEILFDAMINFHTVFVE